jgi:hypothetical protein
MSQTPQQLSQIEAIQARITRARELEARYAQDTSAQGQIIYRRAQQLLVNLERRRDIEQRNLVNQQTLNKELATFAKSYAKLSSSVKNQLQTQSSINSQTSIYKKLGEDIAKSKAREENLTGDTLKHEQERGSFMSEINASLLSQAKATAKAIDDAEGLTEFDKMRRDLKDTMVSLSAEERTALEDAINLTEELYKKEERIKILQEQQKGLYEAIPESMRGGIEFAQKLGNTLKTAGAGAVGFMLLATVITAAITSFTALDTAAKEFRDTTGLTNSQMEGIKSDANEIVGQFGNLGVEAKGVFDTVAALKSEFSDTVDFSKETVAALTLMNSNFGVAAADAAKVQGIMEQVGGLSSETAASVGMQAINMAKAAGVAPAKVMADIAENAEAASTFFKGDLTALTKNAIQARRMGSSLKEQVALSEKLLDFEGSIEEELVAATFVSGQFNLSRARALAFEGKTAEAAEETLKQIQRSGDFRKKDFFTQQQLAKASGMTVEEINKQLNVQEKLSNLSTEEREKAEKAIEQGLDITKIDQDQLALETEKFAKQQEQQATLEQISNQFMGIAAIVGSSLVPVLEAMGKILTPIGFVVGGIFNALNYIPGILPGIIAGFGALYLISKKAAIQARIKAISEIFAGNAKFGPLGIIAAAAGVGALVSLISTPSPEPTGDLSSPADGKTIVSTKEGGLFELSPNDDLVAAPGAAAALAGGGVVSGDGSSNTINVDFSILSAPLNMMISEIKGLRADMASGKIGVYMDTEKVTSKIGRQVDSSTRNNFNLGQA